jgi:DNA topoisomerase-1
VGKPLVVVESPAKARTLSKFIGKDYTIRSSVGHVIDLPRNELGVDLKNNFQPKYVVIHGKNKILEQIKKAARAADEIFLAPDPDREGEAIAWHIASQIDDGKKKYRVTFHEITRKAVLEAFQNPGGIDINRVNAQQARRILDRLVGYQISPLLWKYVKTGLSAGRVQSVALRIICDREKEIRGFKPEEYWTITANLRGEEPPEFAARLIQIEGEKASLNNEAQARAVVEAVQHLPFRVKSVEQKEKKRNPFPPFITSTLQQDASVRCRFSPSRTMRIAQRLYEGIDVGERGTVGVITYMRTDSTRVAQQAIYAARDFIGAEFGGDYVPRSPRYYTSSKMAQQAHEAIRPTMADLTPDKARPFLTAEQFELYELIWNRFIASQMASAVYDTVEVEIEADGYLFKAIGSVMKFDGFLRVYRVSAPAAKEEEGEKKEGDVVLPPLQEGQDLLLVNVLPEQHFTKPPPRFTEASLVRELEKLGIGRPSTYAIIVTKIQDRNYTSKVKGRLVPTELGFLVTDKLVENFPDILNVGFTAGMESNLDEIEEGKGNWVETLRAFYSSFSRDLEQASEGMRVEPVKTEVLCEKCGSAMLKRWGKNGFFLACSAYPECANTKGIIEDGEGKLVFEGQEAEEACEKCGGKMVLRKGKYGPFLACSNYPECKSVRSLSGRTEPRGTRTEPEQTDEKCEVCGKPLVYRRSRYGKFLACSGYPKCKYIKKQKLADISCPREGCDGKIVRRRTKRRRTFYGCSRYPECDFAVWNLDELKEKSQGQRSPE